MVSREDVEGYIARLGDGTLDYEEVEEGLWLVTQEGTATSLVVNYTPPVVVMRVKVAALPADRDRRSELMRKVLEFNANELVHGSYGLEGDDVVLTAAHELENLDFNELRASFDSIMLALASHVPALAKHGEA
jgi:CesT_Tir_1